MPQFIRDSLRAGILTGIGIMLLPLLGLGFTVAVLVGAALAWSILARVKALSDGARAFGEGNFSYRVQLEGHDELGRLASVFNAMAAELDKTHRALRETSIRGGEEFVVIMPETDKPGAGVLAQPICAAVGAHTFSADEIRALNVTVSVGLAGFPEDAESGDELIAAADRALYDAKRAGRNCVRSFDPGRHMENHR